MAVPKKRKSKARRDQRRSHFKITAPNVIDCPQCTEPMLPHRVCPKCGYYKGRQVVVVKS
jgi:large subunit ribosomal protein L32